jgi:Deoxycytidylate deaminase
MPFNAQNVDTGTEVVIGLVGAVGTELTRVMQFVEQHLSLYKYNTRKIKISEEIISSIFPHQEFGRDQYQRISTYMDMGNKARKESCDFSILALGAAEAILNAREKDSNEDVMPRFKQAYIIDSLKHPAEVAKLRWLYPNGFYLIGVYASEQRRREYLTNDLQIAPENADKLIHRDMNENEKYGQQTRDAFQMSDFFVEWNGNDDQLKHDLWRVIDLIFGHPFLTPTFEEFAMFMAFTSSLRSADLSRQVGAVIANNKSEIISMGANDCTKFGGGLYWPHYDQTKTQIIDDVDGRDYKRKCDSNKVQLNKMIDELLDEIDEDDLKDPSIDSEATLNVALIKEKLRSKILHSPIKNITEYGRVVHAEMEAILMCARNNISTKGTTLFCTTFPCHNCAKHIIDAGIEKVIYIEPYPKSKAFDFHSECITALEGDQNKVEFLPFVGIGPRKFFDLFSMTYGSGYAKKRKEENGKAIEWTCDDGKVRVPLVPVSYLDLELIATNNFDELRRRISDGSIKKASEIQQ